MKTASKLGLVLSGGGARGAYEAGVVHYLRTMLPPVPGRDFSVYCGSSVGAVNACFLAATAHDPVYQGRRCREIWKELRQGDIYRRGVLSLARLATSSFYHIFRNVFTRRIDRPARSVKDHFRGLMDTSPFAPFLERVVPWRQISVNLKNGVVDAVSVTATNVRTGSLELFVERRPDVPYTGHYVHHDVKLDRRHALASSAIPIVFPAVRAGRGYYVDGGLRLNTPMSPAIQLGADRLLVIGPHADIEGPEPVPHHALETAQRVDPPSLGMLLGKMFSAIFIDRLEYDVEQMGRINRIIEWGEGCFGPDFLDRVNGYLKENRITGDIANRGLKKLHVTRVAPSVDIRDLFQSFVERNDFAATGLTSLERTLLKVLDVDLEGGTDFLSYILFYPPYLNALMDLGFQDARKNHDRLAELFAG